TWSRFARASGPVGSASRRHRAGERGCVGSVPAVLQRLVGHPADVLDGLGVETAQPAPEAADVGQALLAHDLFRAVEEREQAEQVQCLRLGLVADLGRLLGVLAGAGLI